VCWLVSQGYGFFPIAYNTPASCCDRYYHRYYISYVPKVVYKWCSSLLQHSSHVGDKSSGVTSLSAAILHRPAPLIRSRTLPAIVVPPSAQIPAEDDETCSSNGKPYSSKTFRLHIYIKLLAHMRCYLFRMDYDGCAKLVKIYVVSNILFTLLNGFYIQGFVNVFWDDTFSSGKCDTVFPAGGPLKNQQWI